MKAFSGIAPASQRDTNMTPARAPRDRYLQVVDQDGTRHLIRISAIQLCSDADPCRDSTAVVVAGRTLIVPVPMDEFVLIVQSN